MKQLPIPITDDRFAERLKTFTQKLKCDPAQLRQLLFQYCYYPIPGVYEDKTTRVVDLGVEIGVQGSFEFVKAVIIEDKIKPGEVLSVTIHCIISRHEHEFPLLLRSPHFDQERAGGYFSKLNESASAIQKYIFPPAPHKS